DFLLSPVIRYLARHGLRPPLAAALMMVALLATLGGGAYALAEPARRWAAEAPQSIRRAETRLRDLVRPVQHLSRTAAQVERAAGSVGGGEEREREVVVRAQPTLAARVFGTTERLVVGLLEVVVLLYFLLAGGDLFLQKLIKVLPSPHHERRAVEFARATETAVSAYLSTTLLLAVTEAVVMGVLLWLIGLPNPALWAALIACLEFIPYLGAVVIALVLAVAGLTTFDSLGRAFLAPAAYLAVNLLWANVASPLLLGHRLTLNPVAIVVGLAFFFWIWGVPGAFLAIPLLATLKIACDQVPSLAAVGEFLGQRDGTERRSVLRA
ncbi:MAG TPA: AI-2E family transporter, partial [Gemmatimonadaceae bacterium]|nr:AI-2E family transporter [Gemmatimonadaceae bacterium]